MTVVDRASAFMKELTCSPDQLHTTQWLLCARGVGHVKQWSLLPAICTRVFLVFIVVGKVVCNFQQHIATVTDTQSSLTGVLTYNGCSLGQECSESRTAAAVAQTELSGVKYFTSISIAHN